MRHCLAIVILALGVEVAQAQMSQSAVAGIRRPAMDSLLPVLDDSGQVIPEDLILATMRPASTARSVVRFAVGALIGGLLFNVVTPHPPGHADCSIYEPCTNQERVYRDFSWVVGAGVGMTIAWAAGSNEVTRWKAVEILRAKRRAPETR